MDADDLAAGAFAESVVFLRFFNDLSDSHQRGKVKYPLSEILLLRRFRPFADGTPSHGP